MRELVPVAGTEEQDGRTTAGAPIVGSERARTRELAKELG
jgi:hypothetical protein